MEANYLFVYGTEKRRGPDHSVIEDAKFVAEGTIQGTMYDLGVDMPGVVVGARDLVYGELFSVTEDILEETDLFSGANPADPDAIFERKEVDVQLPERKKIKAWAYLITDQKLNAFFAFPVKSGKWNN